MSTGTTSPKKPVSSARSPVKSAAAPAVDKGKGRAEGVEHEEEDDDEEDEDEDEEMDDEEDDEDEDELDEIDPADILPSGRRTRGVRVNYASKEALSKAGLEPEGDADGEGEDSYVHDNDDAMKH